jgi:Na+/H+ antiporter NhaC
MQTQPEPCSLNALLPFLTFLSLYIGIGICLTLSGHEYAFYQFPAASCALIGFAVALVIKSQRIDEQIKVFTQGIGDESVILMCLIFMLAGAFSSVTQAMGGVDATVSLGLYWLPDAYLLPGIFIIAALLSLATGTTMGTIGTVVPIAIGIATKSGLDLPITIGAVIGGATFGDNLSVISDTAIIASSSQGCSMRSKTIANLKIALPAALITLVFLFFSSKPTLASQVLDFSFIKTLPYLVVLALSITGLNVIIVLMSGIALGAFIGISSATITFLQFGKATNDGFSSMAEVFFLTVLIAGLAAIATKDGGINYLLSKLQKLIRSKRSAEIGIAAFVSVADICIANNTVAILVTGKMARKIREQFGVSAARSASLLDTFSCVWQSLIPHGAQLLLAGGLSKLSPFEIIPYAWYPVMLGLIAGLFILLAPKEEGAL